IHGAIVNWCGHRYGYRSFDNGDGSRNTLPLDVVTMGELFQNNHHKYPMSPNFAARWFEIDPTWQVMTLLAWAGVIEIATPHKAIYPAPAPTASFQATRIPTAGRDSTGSRSSPPRRARASSAPVATSPT